MMKLLWILEEEVSGIRCFECAPFKVHEVRKQCAVSKVQFAKTFLSRKSCIVQHSKKFYVTVNVLIIFSLVCSLLFPSHLHLHKISWLFIEIYLLLTPNTR